MLKLLEERDWVHLIKLLKVLLKLLIAISFLALLLLLGRIISFMRSSLIILFLSLFFVYLLLPIVRFMEKKFRLSRVGSLLLVYLAILIISTLIALAFIPYLSSQFLNFVKDLPKILEESTFNFLSFLQLISKRLSAVLPTIQLKWNSIFEKLYMTLLEVFKELFKNLPLQTLSFFFNTFLVFIEALLVGVITFYLLKDYEEISEHVRTLLKPFDLDYIFDFLEETISGFGRGQLIAGLYILILVTTLLSVAKVNYALLVGFIAGALELIPFLGAFVGFTLSVLLAFSKGLWMGVLVTIGLLVGYQVLAKVIYPYLVGRILELSPATILIAIVIGGEIGGVLGMFLAVPTASIIKKLIFYHLRKRGEGNRDDSSENEEKKEKET